MYGRQLNHVFGRLIQVHNHYDPTRSSGDGEKWRKFRNAIIAPMLIMAAIGLAGYGVYRLAIWAIEFLEGGLNSLWDWAKEKLSHMLGRFWN